MIGVYTILLLSTIVSAIAALLIKFGAKDFTLHPVKLLMNWKFVLGVVLYLASMVVYVILLRYLPLSVAYPMTSATYIWVALLSKKYLNEDVNSWRWGGISLIIVGITLVSW